MGYTTNKKKKESRGRLYSNYEIHQQEKEKALKPINSEIKYLIKR